ncbi:MAG: hypothetical protein LUD69_08250 [Oscillospiraceae bacterium]|nr:hypothetical protein [Oscillospiraceae bacterium]
MKKSLLCLCMVAAMLLGGCSSSNSTELKNNPLFQDVADSIETVTVVACSFTDEEDEEIFTTSDPEEIQSILVMFNGWNPEDYEKAAIDGQPTHIIYFGNQVEIRYLSDAGNYALVGTVYCSLPRSFKKYVNNIIKEAG